MPEDSEQSPLTHLKLIADTSSILRAISGALAEARLLYGDFLPHDDMKALLRDCIVPSLRSEGAEAHTVFTFDHKAFSRQCADLFRQRQGEMFAAATDELNSAFRIMARSFAELLRALQPLPPGWATVNPTPPHQKVQIGPLDV